MTLRSAFAAITLASLAAVPAASQQQEYAEQVLQVAKTELQTWINDPVLVYAITEQNKRNGTISPEEIARLDRIWIAEDGHGPMTFDLLDRQASVILRDRRAQSNGVITEIIVMDAYGLNVAISDPTSDFYQGDEAKYQKTFLVGPDAIHVSDIAFDESTLKIQTQVSLTVVAAGGGNPIGAVTFGINLDVLNN